MEHLVEALKLMACSADAQIAALPDCVVVADEVDDEFPPSTRHVHVDRV
jgi:hypothetical protein